MPLPQLSGFPAATGLARIACAALAVIATALPGSLRASEIFSSSFEGDELPAGTCLDDVVLRDIVPPGPGDLVVTEYLPNPGGATAADDAGKEWFEVLVVNDVDLNGLVIKSGTAVDSLPPSGACIEAQSGSLLVFANGDALGAGLPGVDFAITIPLANAGTCPNDVPDPALPTLGLEIGGAVVDHVCYTTAPAAASRSVNASSKNAVDNDAEAAWCTSTGVYANLGGIDHRGSPGAPSPDEVACLVPAGSCLAGETIRAIVPPVAGDLVITEVMANPDGSTAVDDFGKEWFEVLAFATVDLNGVVVRRTTVTEPLPAGPECFTVTPGTYLLFSNGDTTSAGLPRVDFDVDLTLDNTGTCPGGVPDPASPTLALEAGGSLIDQICYTAVSTAASRTVKFFFENATDNDLPESWCTSTSVYANLAGLDHKGTPGVQDQECF